ncbi:hydrolase [soil metagenome]
MSRLTIEQDDLAILIIDVQPHFLDGWMAGSTDVLLSRIQHLIGLAVAYDLPIAATFEQPVEKKGWLPAKLDAIFPQSGLRMTKNTFNCCGEMAIVSALQSMSRSQFAIAGGETDVCVLQSVLGLIQNGYQVFLLVDCLFSEEPNTGPAIRRMERAGAIPSTVKTLAYELRLSVERPAEKTILGAIADPSIPVGDPEELPPWQSGS